MAKTTAELRADKILAALLASGRDDDKLVASLREGNADNTPEAAAVERKAASKDAPSPPVPHPVGRAPRSHVKAENPARSTTGGE